MKAILILALLPGCGVVSQHYDMRNKEIEYRHQERMREIELQKRCQETQAAPIVHENPF